MNVGLNPAHATNINQFMKASEASKLKNNNFNQDEYDRVMAQIKKLSKKRIY